MTYSVKEIFYTLQGEGAQVGRAAVFLRFSGCNLWSGLEKDRASAICNFCDTDFVGVGPEGGKFVDAASLALALNEMWPDAGGGKKYVVCTGGEPLLQLDEPLIREIHAAGFEIGVETNGTIVAPAGIDWICVSPKSTAALIQSSGSELKVVFPQHELDMKALSALEFDFFYIQPMAGPSTAKNTVLAIEFCLNHPQWRLSHQTHKLVGLR